MELPQFIEMQMRQFLDEQALVEENKTPEELAYRGDERAGIILQKDYEKIVKNMILNGRLGDAKEEFNELKSKYNSIPRGNIYEKQVVFDVLQNVYDILTNHIEDQAQKEDILLKMQGSANVFDVNIKPATIHYDDVKQVVEHAVEDALKRHDDEHADKKMPPPPVADVKEQLPEPPKEPEIHDLPAVKQPKPQPEPDPEPQPEAEPEPDPEPEMEEEEVTQEDDVADDEEIGEFEQVSKALDDADLFLLHHNTVQAKEKLLDAKKILDSLDEKYEQDAESLFERYETLKRELARQYMSKEQHQKKLLLPEELVGKYKKGLILFFEGNYNDAADIFRFIVEQNDKYLPAKIRLAECIERSKWNN